MPNLRPTRLVCAIAVVAMVGTGLWIGFSQPRYFSSPTAPRMPGEPWLEANFAANPRPAPDLLTPAEVTVKISEREVRIVPKRRLRPQASSFPRQETVVAGRGLAAAFAGRASVRPIAGSLGYAIGEDQGRYLLETTEFDPGTGALTAGLAATRPDLAELMKFWPNREIGLGTGALTHVGLAYELTNLQDVQRLENTLWNGQTNVLCDRNPGGFAVRDRVFYDSFYFNALHPFPAMVEVNFRHGPARDFLLKPRTGEEAACESFRFAILHVMGGRIAGATAGNGEVSVRLRENAAENAANTLFFTSWSSLELRDWADFEVVDKAGRAHSFQRREATSSFAIFEVKLAQSDIAAFRLRFRPFLKRAVFELGVLPGMPAENQGVTNLFDVTVPYANRVDDYQEELVSKLVQMSLDPRTYFTGQPPKTGKVYRNATVREIWEDALANHDPEVRFQLDRANHKIVALPPRFQWLRDRAPAWLPIPR